MARRARTLAAALVTPALAIASPSADSCTNYLVTKGATVAGGLSEAGTEIPLTAVVRDDGS